VTAPALAIVPEANTLLEFRNRYYWDPEAFVREQLGAVPDTWQKKVLHDLAVGKLNISIRSGHGPGKTALLAWIINWFMATRSPQKTACTAATSAQLFDALVPETKMWLSRLPEWLKECFVPMSDSIVHVAGKDESFVSFRTSRAETPEAIAGVHSANVLLICDEASGIPEAVYESAMGSMSTENALFILAGNPVRSSGFFFNTHHKLRAEWSCHHVNCEEQPRVSRRLIKLVADTYGKDSNAYRVRVQGEFPKAEDDKIIPFELAEAALKRQVDPIMHRAVWGVDCARYGQDRSALAIRQGNVLVQPVLWWAGLNTMELAGRIKAIWDQTLTSQRPVDICVDAMGIGAGVADRLREMGLPCRAVNVSESPALKDRFLNLRAELWWQVREWLESRTTNLSNDEALMSELLLPSYGFSSSGRLKVESKDEMKSRGERSPDLADAFVMTFAAMAASALYGSTLTATTRQALIRDIKGIV
jgi:phage terminase large subunit